MTAHRLAQCGPNDAHPTLRAQPATAATCRSLYGMLAAGVCVVTASGDQEPAGMTASSVLAVSLEPPLLLASLTNGSRTLATLSRTGRFAVNLLCADQQNLAHRFAQDRPGWAKFASVDLVHADPPVLAGVLSASVCTVADVVRAGDHHLVIGTVETVWSGTGAPLVWHQSALHTLEDLS